MKTILVLAGLLAALTANAQTPPPEGALESQLSARLGKTASLSSEGVKANEIMKGHIIYSGIAVELLKTRKPLQLINPLAPAEYGSPEDNVMRDPVTKHVTAWKIFSISF